MKQVTLSLPSPEAILHEEQFSHVMPEISSITIFRWKLQQMIARSRGLYIRSTSCGTKQPSECWNRTTNL